jgi:Tfp pilus assembly protein PilN
MRRKALSGATGRGNYPSIDINILPDRYRPRRLSWRAARPWALAAAFLLLAVPSWRLNLTTTGIERAADQRLTDVRTALRAYTPLAEEKSALEAQIEEANRQAAEIEAAHASVSIQTERWSDLLREILNIVPAGVELTTLDQGGSEVTIVGLADNHDLPMTLSDALISTGSFETVTVNSIVRRTLAEPADDQSGLTSSLEVFEFELTLGLASQEVGQ